MTYDDTYSQGNYFVFNNILFAVSLQQIFVASNIYYGNYLSGYLNISWNKYDWNYLRRKIFMIRNICVRK